MSIYTLNIDVDNKKLVPAGSGGSYEVPSFSVLDTAQLRIAFLRQNNGVLEYVNFANSSIKVAIGETSATPTEGEFKLTWNGITSSNIPYNATTTQVQSALANAVSASVSELHCVSFGWLITMTTPGIFSGTTAGLGGSSYTLYPSSSVLINTNRPASSGIQMRQVVRLVQQPAAFNDSFQNSETKGGATLTLTQSGTATQSAIYALKIDQDVYSGQYNLIFGTQAVGLPFNATAPQIQDELSKLTGIGKFLDSNSVTRSNVQVGGENGSFGITFVGNLSNTNIVSAFVVNDSALVRPPFKVGVLTINTDGISNLFADKCNPDLYFEIEVVQDGNRNSVFKDKIELDANPLIVAGASVPASQSSYYTKSEADSVFIKDTTTNVDATNRRLKDSSGTTIVDYGNSLFGSAGMVNLSASQVVVGAYPVYVNAAINAASMTYLNGGLGVSGSLGFYGTSPISQPAGANVVSNVISLGLISSSSTYGVLPSTIKTLTTQTTLTFGTIAASTVVTESTPVTGASVQDIVLIGLPTSVSNGIIVQGVVNSANTVMLTAVNTTTSSQDLGSATYRITVIGY